jgi:hypothetical protein
MKAAAMIFALCTIPANAEAPEHASFLEAAIFFAVGLEPPIIKIESDKRAIGALNRYEVSDEDPCVLYDIPPKDQVIRIDFSKLPSPRAMLIRPGLPGQIEAQFALPPEASCSWRGSGASQKPRIECANRYGIAANTQNHLVRRLRALGALFALQAAQTVDLVALHRVAVLSRVAAKTKR